MDEVLISKTLVLKSTRSCLKHDLKNKLMFFLNLKTWWKIFLLVVGWQKKMEISEHENIKFLRNEIIYLAKKFPPPNGLQCEEALRIIDLKNAVSSLSALFESVIKFNWKKLNF